MAGYENYAVETREIEQEIVRKGVILGIDWNDAAQVRALAREALEHHRDALRSAIGAPLDYQQQAKIDLFGLAGIMLKTMAESANHGIESHGGDAWKAFARALWAESGLPDDQPQRKSPQ
jgi:hypothetical protein